MKSEWKKLISNDLFPFGIIFTLCLGLLSSCSKPFPESPLLDLVLLQFIKNQAITSDANSTSTTANTTKYIFVTQVSFQGNLGGVSGADTICQNEKTNNFPTLPGASTEYMALLVDGVARVACVASNCTTTVGNNTNWVLQANTRYFRPDEQLIFQTNGAGIFVFGTLTNAFSTVGGNQWWTGIDPDWTTIIGDDCSNWTNNAAIQGLFGIGASQSDTSISDFASEACSNFKKLLCVRN